MTAQERLGIMFWIVNPMWLGMIPAATAIAFGIWPVVTTVVTGAVVWLLYVITGLIWILSRPVEDNEREIERTDDGP